ncbi:MAG: 50S ribosomal protein L11 methyltransferase [Pseudomonadota bacterium]
MTWLQLQFITHPEQIESLEATLLASGAVAVTMQDDADQPLLEPGVGETPLWNQIRLTGLYPADTQMSGVLDQFSETDLQHTPHRIEILEDKDWEREWMSHYRPMQFGRRLWVCPSWQEPPEPDAVNLMLDPGLAFGTGTHPTTALCLSELDAIAPAGCAVVDYGCGSGILSAAALKLGARKALAVDNDPQALVATRDNARRNQLSDTLLEVSGPDQYDRHAWSSQADLVVANILAGPLIALSDTLLDLLKPGGTLLLAGMLDTQIDSLRTHYAPHITLAVTAQQEGWACLRGDLHPI